MLGLKHDDSVKFIVHDGLPLTAANIERLNLLPHRGRALSFIDGVVDFRQDDLQLTAVKELSATFWPFEGHFPDQPTLPGYAQLEMANLATALLFRLLFPEVAINSPSGIIRLECVKFARPAFPGDTLFIQSVAIAVRSRAFMVNAKITNQRNELVSSFETLTGVRLDGGRIR